MIHLHWCLLTLAISDGESLSMKAKIIVFLLSRWSLPNTGIRGCIVAIDVPLQFFLTSRLGLWLSLSFAFSFPIAYSSNICLSVVLLEVVTLWRFPVFSIIHVVFIFIFARCRLFYEDSIMSDGVFVIFIVALFLVLSFEPAIFRMTRSLLPSKVKALRF